MNPPVTRRRLPLARALAALGMLLLATTAAAQSIAVQGSHFVVDQADGKGPQARFLIFVSYNDALRAPEQTLTEDLDYIARTLHFDGIRIYAMWWDDSTENACRTHAAAGVLDANGHLLGDTTPASGPLARLIHVLEQARARGLMVDVSFARETVPDLSVQNYTRGIARLATVLRPYRNVLFDLQNERDLADRPQQFLSRADVQALRNAILVNPDPKQGDPTRLVVASNSGSTSVTDTVSFVTQTSLSAVAYHDPRDTDWYAHVPTIVAGLAAARRPVYLQEPMAWASGVSLCHKQEGRPTDGNPAHFRMAVTNAKAAGAAAWTFHTRQGFVLATGGSLKAQVQRNPDEKALLEGSSRMPPLRAVAAQTSWR